LEEFRVYEGLFHQLEKLYGGSLSPHVSDPFFSLKALVNGDPSSEEESLAQVGSFWTLSESSG
jgi:hypothetical protein